jgi:hypothetical protein
MSPLEQAAFIEAYGRNVASASHKDVAEFVRRYALGEDLDYSGDYTTIMDAIGMWNYGIKFEREKATKSLVDKVIDQMKLDFSHGDFTAIEEMLKTVDENTLQGYLPEGV